MNQSYKHGISLTVSALLAGMLALSAPGSARASDHLDSPTAISNPQADIGDMFAWVSPNGRQLNLVMDIVGKSFSGKIKYIFHIDNGKSYGNTTAATAIVCRFPDAKTADCWVGDIDSARGDANHRRE
jgi:hypothetical protein